MQFLGDGLLRGLVEEKTKGWEGTYRKCYGEDCSIYCADQVDDAEEGKSEFEAGGGWRRVVCWIVGVGVVLFRAVMRSITPRERIYLSWG